MQPSIFAIGIPLPSIERFTTMHIESNDSWLDADIIVVEPHLSTFETLGAKGNVPSMTASSALIYRAFRDRWRQQLQTALEHGKIVVFLLPAVEQRNYNPPGTNQTSHTTNYSLTVLPLADFSHVKGRQMALTNHAAAITEYWKAMGVHSQYQCLFTCRDSVPIVTTSTGNQMCGCWVPNAGHLFVLPSINWSSLNYGDEIQSDPLKEGYEFKLGQINFAKQLRQALASIHKNLKAHEPVMEAPDWVTAPEYYLGREEGILGDLAANRAEAARLAVMNEELEGELASEQAMKALLFGSGKPLEAAVRRALSLLGFQTTNFVSERSEFDVVFTSAEGRFIGEVEGRDNKAIAVEKASQLHRNIAEDFDRDDVDEMAQGVLFGNAFRMKPIAERAEVFTDKVVTFSGTANIALVRTADLFRAVQHVLATSDDAFAQHCREAIANSKGRIVEFPPTDR